MNLLRQINGLRRKAFGILTKGIGASHVNYTDLSKPPIEKILICRPNHRLGNLLLVTPLLQEVFETLPNAKVDLLVKGSVGPELFKNYNIHKIIQLPRRPFRHFLDYIRGWWSITTTRYDLAINVIDESSSGKISTRIARSRLKIYGDLQVNPRAGREFVYHNAKRPVVNFREFMSSIGVEKTGELPSMDLKLSINERYAGKSILKTITDANNPTICLFTYATGDKCYSKDWWSELFIHLQSIFSDHNIIEVLPLENISQLDFKAPSYYSKDIRELGSLIAATNIFIGADSGMMHLASAVQTPTVGLFKVTNPHAYGPYGNLSSWIDTKKVSTPELIHIVKTTLAASSLQREKQE